MSIQRYEVTHDFAICDTNGRWVKADEAIARIAELEAENKRLRAVVDAAKRVRECWTKDWSIRCPLTKAVAELIVVLMDCVPQQVGGLRWGCLVEQAADGKWDVHNPARTHFYAQGWWYNYDFWTSKPGEEGIFSDEAEALAALAECQTPVPGVTP